ncbi:MAG: helix-turn-helix domain-containing protein [Xenococcaceae cyanobacterium]
MLFIAPRQKAIALLKDSQLNLTDIAHQLGYANSANFCRASKRWTNFSPGYFRQQHISSTNWREMTRNQK